MDESAEKEKRKIHRSPSYPVFGLQEAIQKADAVYRGERRSATTPEVIASHMGYSQANGPGGRAVSALRQFGLIEENAGKYRISELGYTLVHFDRNSEEWRAAAIEAVKRPTLFKELLEEYPEGLPSDATLRNDLLKRGFNPAAISDVVSIFRSTVGLAGAQEVVYDGAVIDTTERSQKEQGSDPFMRTKAAEKRNSSLAQISTPVGTEEGQVVFAHVQFDSPIRKEFVSSLKKYLDYLETTLN